MWPQRAGQISQQCYKQNLRFPHCTVFPQNALRSVAAQNESNENVWLWLYAQFIRGCWFSLSGGAFPKTTVANQLANRVACNTKMVAMQCVIDDWVAEKQLSFWETQPCSVTLRPSVTLIHPQVCIQMCVLFLFSHGHDWGGGADGRDSRLCVRHQWLVVADVIEGVKLILQGERKRETDREFVLY